jgi:Carboxypeptidase regulatory-like domain/TonB dependent receptor
MRSRMPQCVVRADTGASVGATATDGSGRFSLSGLQPGTYSIETSVPGFDMVLRRGVHVTTGSVEEMTIRLSLANISETVTVFLGGDSLTRGIEAESTILAGGGVALHLNGTAGTAKYRDTGLRVQNAPRDTETVGLTYNRAAWNVGFFTKRVGRMYNDNGSIHEAVPIDPFDLTNRFVNYTVGGRSRLSSTRIRFAVNNLTDSHAITAITPASTKRICRRRATC